MGKRQKLEVKTVNGDICGKKQISVKAVVETCHGRFYFHRGERPVLFLVRSNCTTNSRRASDDLCFSNSLALFNAWEANQSLRYRQNCRYLLRQTLSHQFYNQHASALHHNSRPSSPGSTAASTNGASAGLIWSACTSVAVCMVKSNNSFLQFHAAHQRSPNHSVPRYTHVRCGVCRCLREEGLCFRTLGHLGRRPPGIILGAHVRALCASQERGQQVFRAQEVEEKIEDAGE